MLHALNFVSKYYIFKSVTMCEFGVGAVVLANSLAIQRILSERYMDCVQECRMIDIYPTIRSKRRRSD